MSQIDSRATSAIRPSTEGLKRNWHRFSAQGADFLYDVISGSLHILDEDAALLVDRIADGSLEGALVAERAEGEGRLAEAYSELSDLLQQGLLTDPDEGDPEIGWSHERVVKALCLHIAHDCDMRCAYCFAGQGGFGGIRKLMDAEVGKAALDFLARASGDVRHLEVDFFGGEPLMNMDAVARIVEHGRLLEGRYGKVMKFTLTTNALSLSDEHIKFLNDNDMAVVLSMDGRPEVHDRVRRADDGGATSGRITENCLRFVNSRQGKDYYARGTYTALNLDFQKDVEYVADLGFDRVSFEPVVLFDGTPMQIRPEHLPGLFEEYDRLVEFMLKRKGEGRPFLFFHFDMSVAKGPCLAKRLSGCGAGADYVAVTPEGDIYPCHQFVGREEFKLGDVWNGIGRSDTVASFSEANVYSKKGCKDCWARFFCSGGCHANAFASNGDILEPYAIGCAITKKRLECALRLQAGI